MPECATAGKVRIAVNRAFSLLGARLELPGELLVRRPQYQDAWTIVEHLEHVALANHFLLLTIGKGCRLALRRATSGKVQEGESDLELLSAIAVPGGFEWLPPPHMVPSGSIPLAELAARFASQKEKCLALLAAMPRGEGRLCSIRMSVNHSGWLDMYQWMYFLVQHARYHLALIDRLLGSK